MAADPDFSAIPCAGKVCFPRAVAERKACTEQPHMCPSRVDDNWWQCRCCAACKQRCSEDANG